MKEYISELIRGAPTPLQARNLVREYLQARILGAMQRAGAMIPLSFHGGTALRFLLQYLSDPTWPHPNFLLLNNALRRTKWPGPELTERN